MKYTEFDALEAKLKMIRAVEKEKGTNQKKIDEMCEAVKNRYFDDILGQYRKRAIICVCASLALIFVLIDIAVQSILRSNIE